MVEEKGKNPMIILMNGQISSFLRRNLIKSLQNVVKNSIVQIVSQEIRGYIHEYM
jgi:hypothetical protein